MPTEQTLQTRRPKPYPANACCVICREIVCDEDCPAVRPDPYIEEATANPERINNGTMIYKRGA